MLGLASSTLVFLLALVAHAFIHRQTNLNDAESWLVQFVKALESLSALSVPSLALGLGLTCVVYLLCVLAYSQFSGVSSRPVDVYDAWLTRPRSLRFLALTFLTVACLAGAMTFGPFITLASLVSRSLDGSSAQYVAWTAVGVLFVFWMIVLCARPAWLVVVPIAANETRGLWASLRRSSDLGKGCEWALRRVLLSVGAVGIGAAAIAALVQVYLIDASDAILSTIGIAAILCVPLVPLVVISCTASYHLCCDQHPQGLDQNSEEQEVSCGQG